MNARNIHEALSGVGLLVVLAGLVFIFGHCVGCASAASKARPAAYGAELAACTEAAKTCAESIECENRVRSRYGRPPRTGGCE